MGVGIKCSFLSSHIKYLEKNAATIEMVENAANIDIVGKGVNMP